MPRRSGPGRVAELVDELESAVADLKARVLAVQERRAMHRVFSLDREPGPGDIEILGRSPTVRQHFIEFLLTKAANRVNAPGSYRVSKDPMECAVDIVRIPTTQAVPADLYDAIRQAAASYTEDADTDEPGLNRRYSLLAQLLLPILESEELLLRSRYMKVTAKREARAQRHQRTEADLNGQPQSHQ